MKKKWFILYCYLSIVLTFTVIDYLLITDNKFPLFTLKIMKENSNKEVFLGFPYLLKREINKDSNESLKDSKDVTYYFLFFKSKINFNVSRINPIMKFSYSDSDITLTDFYNKDNNYFYSSYIKNLTINYNNTNYSLESFLNTHDIDEIFLNAKSTKYFKNYAYTLYTYPNLMIIKCHMEYDKEYKRKIIFKLDTKKIDNICNINSCLIKKEYQVLKKIDNNYLNLENVINKNIITVQVAPNIYKELLVNGVYLFTFNTDNKIDFSDDELLFKVPIISLEKLEEKININYNTCL